MAASLSIIAAKDGTGATIVGGIQALDLSGGGTGPWSVANILVDGVSGTLRAAVTAANALKTDGSAVTQPVSGTVTANAGTNMSTASLALETGGNLATIAGAVTSSVVQANLKQVNGITTLAGAGASGTGAQRVTVSQDTTTVAGSAPGTAGTASVNVLTVQGVASMTPVQVSQATAASLNATVVGTGTFAVQAAATLNAETTKVIGTVRNVGNGGGVFDFAGQNATQPANALLIGGEFNTTPTTITSGNASPLQLDNAGNLLVNVKAGSSGNAAASAAGSAVPTDADYGGINVSGTLRGQTGVNPTGVIYAAQTDLTSLNGTSLASPTAFGTAPTGNVIGVNAFVTNSTANGLATAANSSPVVQATTTTEVAVTPTVTASAYTAGNVIGGILTFASLLDSVRFAGILESITVKFKGTAVTGNITVNLFKASPSNGTYTDKTAPTWNAADMANMLGSYVLTTPVSNLGTMTVYNLDGIAKTIQGTTQSVFAVVTVAGTPTPASTSDMTVSLAVLPG